MTKLPSKKINPKNEIVALVTEHNELFAADRKNDLRKAVCELVHTVTSFGLPDYNDADYAAIAAVEGFDEIQAARLQVVCHIAEAEYHMRKKKTAATAGSSEEEDEEAPEETPVEEDGEEDEDSNGEKIKSKLQEYTFGPEIKESYAKMLQRRPVILIFHTRVIFGKEKAADTWDLAKAKIKMCLSALGLECIFLAIDYLAERSRMVRFVLKCIGSVIVPFVALYVVIAMILRFMTNPIKPLLNWAAKEFDFKIDDPQPE